MVGAASKEDFLLAAGLFVVNKLSPRKQAETITIPAHFRCLDGIEPQWPFGSTIVADAIGKLTHQPLTETAND